MELRRKAVSVGLSATLLAGILSSALAGGALAVATAAPQSSIVPALGSATIAPIVITMTAAAPNIANNDTMTFQASAGFTITGNGTVASTDTGCVTADLSTGVLGGVLTLTAGAAGACNGDGAVTITGVTVSSAGTAPTGTISRLGGSAAATVMALGTVVANLATASGTTTANSATPTAPVVRAGGFVGTASYTFTESAVNQFPTNGFVLTIDISDAQGGRTVHFDRTSPIALSPDSLGLSAAISTSNDWTLIVTATTSNAAQLETLGIGGLKIKADASAALGAIRTRYSLYAPAAPTFDLGGKTTASASGRIFDTPGPPADGSTFRIALDNGSPNFTNDADVTVAGVETDTDGNGPIAFTDGLNSEAVGQVVAAGITGGVQTITSTQARSWAHSQFTTVTQTHILLNCDVGAPPDPLAAQTFGVCALASIGAVVDSVAAAPAAADVADGTVSVLRIQRGLANNQAFSPITLDERTTGAAGNGSSSGYIAAGATITLTLDPALGVKFSQPPTATSHVTKASSLGTTVTPLLAAAATTAVVVPGANSVADPFGTTVAATAGAIGFSNLYVNDLPTLFENKAVTEGFANNLTPTAPWVHAHNPNPNPTNSTTAVGQDRIAQTNGTPLGLQANQAGLVLSNGGVADLSADRLTATFHVASASAGGAISQIVIDGYYDASAAAAAAASVTVGIAITGDNVVPPSVVNAILNNTAAGTADAPTVIIGENDQQSGTVTIVEAGAGALGSTAATNVLRICYVDNDTLGTGSEIFTRAPWAVVTAGDLKLRTPSDPTVAGTPAAPGTGVRGDLSYLLPGMGSGHCAQWLVYTASTVASTIEIRGSAADGTMLGAGVAHGPQINVPATMTPGPSTLSLEQVSSFTASGSQFDLVVNAIRVYGGSPIVAATSNPEILRGTINQPAGNVTITETQIWQLGQPGTWVNQVIWFQIVPNNLRDYLPSVYFDTNRNIPIIATNAAATGLVAHFGGFVDNTTFSVVVDQRAYVPITGAWIPGVLTVGSIKYNTTTDAAYGNVELYVCSGGRLVDQTTGTSDCLANDNYAVGAGAENPANISDTVTNAHVVNTGLYPILSIAQGYKTRETTPYITYGTEIIKKGTYVTVRVKIGSQFAGKRIEFWYRAGKTGTWVRKTIGRVDSAGYAYWSTRPPKLTGSGFAKYNYYRAYFAGTSEVAAVWSQTMARVVVK